MGVPVDHIQARVAAKALARDNAKSLEALLEESIDSLRCRSQWTWLRRSTKRFYKTYKREGRAVLWAYKESRRRRRRQATTAIGYINSDGGKLVACLEVLRKCGNHCAEQIASSEVIVTRHAMEAMFHKAARLDRTAVQIDVLNAVTSLFLMGTQDPDYWQVGYGEWEIRTENGIALAVRGEAEPIYTITTWVPECHMRPEQLTGWTTPLVAEPEGILIAAGARPLPRISTSIHRKALGAGRYAAA